VFISVIPDKYIALAAVAHPDDVEFMIAGTLLQLQAVGVEIHIWNLANGCLGSVRHGSAETAAIRWRESTASAQVCQATLHVPLFEDMGIYYDAKSLARVAGVLRQIKPTIIFTHALSDYMEDHQNTARLITSAAFARGMKYYQTDPRSEPYEGPLALYHALPHGLHGPLGEKPVPSHFVKIDEVFAKKREMLAQHNSQREWLGVSQGMVAHVQMMEKTSQMVGSMSGCFNFAEGFNKHFNGGFAEATWDPLSLLLGTHVQLSNKQLLCSSYAKTY
jgi:LmbE family N-acetylglucosaminyl deacetylase